jgi:ribosomal protein S14
MFKTKRSTSNFKKVFYKHEYNKKINKFISIYLNNKSTPLLKYYFTSNNKKKSVSKTKLKSICVLTNRTHSINKTYNISRISLREMFSFGIVPGFKKAVW